MKKALEESSENFDSARSYSGAPSESTNKKKVQFAPSSSPDKFRSSGVSSDDHSSQK